MSKNYGNYPDPKLMIEKYGGDALRLYLAGSPVMHGEDILISEEQYRNQVRGMLLILWNVYNFFVTYALIDKWDKKTRSTKPSQNVLDQWIMSLLNGLTRTITQDFENFDSVTAIAHLQSYVDKLSTWYIRRSRDRVGFSAENQDDKNNFYSTAYTVLTTLTKLAAPLIPFITEEIYRNLTGEESVHLTDWPETDMKFINIELEEEMEHAIQLVSIIHEFRKNASIKVKIPVKKLSYSGVEEFSGDVLAVIREETNVYELEFVKNAKEFTVTGDTSEKNQDLVMGEVRDIIRKIQQERKILGTTFDELVEVYLPSWPERFENEIKKNALVSELIKDTEFKVVRNNV
jgi:isoleucyl-tRNA synthetase